MIGPPFATSAKRAEPRLVITVAGHTVFNLRFCYDRKQDLRQIF